MDRYETLIQSQQTWEADRPIMADHNCDLLTLHMLLSGEVEETGDEIIDALAFKENNGFIPQLLLDKISRELADVCNFVMQMYSIIGFDMFDSIMDKRAYNIGRYAPYFFQGGYSYEEGRKNCKHFEKTSGYKQQYYQVDNIGNQI